ncbi:MAG: metallophosphoesterase [Bacilli bacterium]|nr:metallophosphoesterase [Bacilli bacterium]
MTREERNTKKQKMIDYDNTKDKISFVIKKVLKITIILSCFAFIFFTYTTYISTSKIVVREYRITNEKIPESFNGIKILQFSDLHYGSTMYEENLKEIKKLINERKPDLILFTGDLIDNEFKSTKNQTEKLAKSLKELDATLGKYAILGDEDKEEITTILNQSDFIILKNESDLIYNENNEPILLVGLDSLLNKNQDLEAGYSYFKQESHNANIYTITMVHEPDSVLNITNNYNTDLILAGHSHNGDIKVPIINFPIVQKKGALTYNNDYYKINDTDLYISGGLGTNDFIGIRLFCRPSISLYRLSNK